MRRAGLLRLFWIGAATILVVAALVALAAVTTGTFDTTDAKILGVLGTLLLAGGVATVGASLREARRSPLLGGIFAFFLLALAGIPLTSGFTGKFAVFSAAVAGGATPLVVVGAIASAMAAFFYVRVIVMMFFAEPVADGPVVVAPGGMSAGALSVAVAATLVLGVFPKPVLDLANHAVPFLR